MNISNTLCDIKNSSVQVLNRPNVKENIKIIIGIVTFIFGLMEILNICQVFTSRTVTNKTTTINLISIAFLCSQLSLVLSAAVSKPGVAIISFMNRGFFSKSQTERIFGQNTIFAINPWHPRHITSIAAVVLAIVGIVAADAKMQRMLLFNVITSRPVLHIGNQFAIKTKDDLALKKNENY